MRRLGRRLSLCGRVTPTCKSLFDRNAMGWARHGVFRLELVERFWQGVGREAGRNTLERPFAMINNVSGWYFCPQPFWQSMHYNSLFILEQQFQECLWLHGGCREDRGQSKNLEIRNRVRKCLCYLLILEQSHPFHGFNRKKWESMFQ